jgi:hypothetical protein
LGAPSATPRRRLILLRHGESTARGRSTRGMFKRRRPRVPVCRFNLPCTANWIRRSIGCRGMVVLVCRFY